MKTLPFAVSRPILLCLFLLLIALGCQKDNFSTLGESTQTSNLPTLSQNFPISIDEAQSYFERLHLGTNNTSSFNGTGAQPKEFVKLDPLWDLSFVGHAQSGKEIVVVPLPDSFINVYNHGRAGAKLLFSKSSPDSIVAQVLLYGADSLYYASQGNTLNFNNFTGAFAFFDLGFNFQYGVYVQAGVPAVLLDSIRIELYSDDVSDREDDTDCWSSVDIYVLCDPAVTPFANNTQGDCYEVMWLGPVICGGPTGGGGGGGGGTGGGGGNGSGGNGGGTGSGGGTGGGGTPTTPTYWDVLNGQIPVELFTGALPPGFTLELFQQLVDLQDYYHFSESQLNWLKDNASVIPILAGPAPTGEEWALIKPVLDFAIAHKLNADQYLFLITHGAVFEQAKSIEDLTGLTSEQITDGIQIHIDLMINDANYSILNHQANYPDIGTETWANTLDGPDDWPGDGFWDLKPAEKHLVLNYPIAAIKIRKNRGIARAKQKAFWGSDPNVLWLGKGDAFLHTYFQAINTQSVGPGLTLLFANAHETDHPAVLHLETEMDLFNNDIGILTGHANPSANIHTMADIVHQRVLNGDCKYLDPVDHILSPPYSGDPASCPTCLNGILSNTVMKWTNQ